MEEEEDEGDDPDWHAPAKRRRTFPTSAFEAVVTQPQLLASPDSGA